MIALVFMSGPKVWSVTPNAAGKPAARSVSQAWNIASSSAARGVGMIEDRAHMYFCLYAGPEIIEVPLAEKLKAAVDW
jgi:hypothetical protein